MLYLEVGILFHTQDVQFIGAVKCRPEIALSTAKADYIVLASALREVLPFITFLT